MKRLLIVLALLASTTAAYASPEPVVKPTDNMTPARWEAFSGSLVRALASDHKGLQAAAMRLAIQYADQANVEAATVDLIKIYRNSDDVNMRLMAVTTLGRIGSARGIEFLARSERFEKSPVVRRHIRATLTDAGVAQAR